jgi:hypothetical protein
MACPGACGHGGMRLFDLAQVARIAIDTIGSDFALFISRLEREAHEKGVVILQVWLPLASPFVSAS